MFIYYPFQSLGLIFSWAEHHHLNSWLLEMTSHVTGSSFADDFIDAWVLRLSAHLHNILNTVPTLFVGLGEAPGKMRVILCLIFWISRLSFQQSVSEFRRCSSRRLFLHLLHAFRVCEHLHPSFRPFQCFEAVADRRSYAGLVGKST